MEAALFYVCWQGAICNFLQSFFSFYMLFSPWFREAVGFIFELIFMGWPVGQSGCFASV